jgi:hypothetical protein
MTERPKNSIERRSARLSTIEFQESILRLEEAPFDEFLVGAATLVFTAYLSHGDRYPEEVLELPNRTRTSSNRRWHESVTIEIVDKTRVEVCHNRSSGPAGPTTPSDSYEGVMVSFSVTDDLATDVVWTRREAKQKSKLDIFPLRPNSNIETRLREVVIEGLTERQHQREQSAAYRKANRKLGWKALYPF